MERLNFSELWDELEQILLSYPSSATVFNQYRDSESKVDIPDAAAIRRRNLRTYLEEASESALVLVVGEAPGPWGMRFSGVPFTGERQLLDPLFPYQGSQSSKSRVPHMSRTAAMFWEVMLPYHKQIICWEAFPLHPHRHDNILSVRNLTRSEVSRFRTALSLVKRYVGPRRILAVGRKAFEQLASLGETSTYVRHPSQGGKTAFTIAMRSIFPLDA